MTLSWRRPSGFPVAHARLAVALLATLAGPRFASADPAIPVNESREQQELTLTRLPRLQEPGEFQLTSGSSRARGDGRFESELEAELGITRWMQIGGGRSLSVLDAEPHSASASLMFGTWSPREGWHAAAGVESEWALQTNVTAGTDAFLLAAFAEPGWELALDAALQHEGDDFTPHAAAALTRDLARLRGILEMESWLGTERSFALAPGLSWHPTAAFELTAEAPFRFASGDVTPSATLKLTYEWELIR